MLHDPFAIPELHDAALLEAKQSTRTLHPFIVGICNSRFRIAIPAERLQDAQLPWPASLKSGCSKKPTYVSAHAEWRISFDDLDFVQQLLRNCWPTLREVSTQTEIGRPVFGSCYDCGGSVNLVCNDCDSSFTLGRRLAPRQTLRQK